MANTNFGHDRNRDGVFDLLDNLRIAHSCDAALCTDVRRDSVNAKLQKINDQYA